MTRLLFPSLVAVLAAAACGDNPAAGNKPPPAGKVEPAKVNATAADSAKASAGGVTTQPAQDATGGADTSAWETDGELPDLETDGAVDDSGGAAAATGDSPPAPTGHAGPCKVTWSSGTVAHFEYTEATGGTIKVDADGDGKPDVCAEFELTDGKPAKVTLDTDCDAKPDQVITTKFLADQNIATASVLDKGTGKTSKLTLVTLPSFTGVVPGYPMLASKRDIGLTVRDGLIRTANVKKPTEGPTLKASFYYDAAQRIRAVKEDFAVDGTVDQRYDYRYDDDGNITRITLTVTGADGQTTKTTGKLDYSCW